MGSAVLCYIVVLCCRVIVQCTVLCRVVLWCAVLCMFVQYCSVLCCDVLECVGRCSVVKYCVVLNNVSIVRFGAVLFEHLTLSI